MLLESFRSPDASTQSSGVVKASQHLAYAPDSKAQLKTHVLHELWRLESVLIIFTSRSKLHQHVWIFFFSYSSILITEFISLFLSSVQIQAFRYSGLCENTWISEMYSIVTISVLVKWYISDLKRVPETFDLNPHFRWFCLLSVTVVLC